MSKQNLTLDELIDCLRHPSPQKRSLAELDTVIDEIMERNPDFVEKLNKIIEKKLNQNE